MLLHVITEMTRLSIRPPNTTPPTKPPATKTCSCIVEQTLHKNAQQCCLTKLHTSRRDKISSIQFRTPKEKSQTPYGACTKYVHKLCTRDGSLYKTICSPLTKNYSKYQRLQPYFTCHRHRHHFLSVKVSSP